MSLPLLRSRDLQCKPKVVVGLVARLPFASRRLPLFLSLCHWVTCPLEMCVRLRRSGVADWILVLQRMGLPTVQLTPYL